MNSRFIQFGYIQGWVLLIVAMVSLTGCSDIRQKLGLGNQAPDEFTVYDRAPLSVPPQFSLRPPRPGTPRPQELSSSQAAQNILAKGNLPAPRPEAGTQGQAEFLQQAGVEKTDTNIRQQIDHDLMLEQKPTNDTLLKDMLFWQKKTPKAKVLDPYEEEKRLEKKETEKKEASTLSLP